MLRNTKYTETESQEIENLNRSITSMEIKSEIENFLKKKKTTSGSDSYSGKF